VSRCTRWSARGLLLALLLPLPCALNGARSYSFGCGSPAFLLALGAPALARLAADKAARACIKNVWPIPLRELLVQHGQRDAVSPCEVGEAAGVAGGIGSNGLLLISASHVFLTQTRISICDHVTARNAFKRPEVYEKFSAIRSVGESARFSRRSDR
jgi:hypothetical protein